eukprot:5381909-Amphidinium_carterae.1
MNSNDVKTSKLAEKLYSNSHGLQVHAVSDNSCCMIREELLGWFGHPFKEHSKAVIMREKEEATCDFIFKTLEQQIFSSNPPKKS